MLRKFQYIEYHSYLTSNKFQFSAVDKYSKIIITTITNPMTWKWPNKQTHLHPIIESIHPSIGLFSSLKIIYLLCMTEEEDILPKRRQTAMNAFCE